VWESEIIQSLIVVSNFCLDKGYWDRYEDMETHFLNGFTEIWSLNSCVPQLSAAEFIRAICKTFALSLEYGDGTLSFKKSKEVVDKPPINLDGRATKQYSIEKSDENGWTLKYSDRDSEKHSDPSQLQPLVTGDGEVIVDLVRTFAMSSDYTSSLGGFLKTPITHQGGVSPILSQGANKSTLPITFLIDRGLRVAELGSDYVMASSDDTDYAGNSTGDFALTIDGEKGLYLKWHKGLVEYSDADLLKFSAVLDIGDMQRILKWDQARARFYHPDGVALGLLKSLKVSANRSGLSIAQMEMLLKRS